MPYTVKRFGWLPDLPDVRDHRYSAPRTLGKLPPRIDLTPGCPPVYDQGALGSCTANAIAAVLEFDQTKQSLADVFVPSRLFIYYNERALEGTVASDSGAQIRDGIKTVASLGACHERLWPYEIAKFAEKPPKGAFTDAAKHTAVAYQRVARDLAQMKGCLASGCSAPNRRRTRSISSGARSSPTQTTSGKRSGKAGSP